MIGVVAATAGGRRAAATLAAAWPGEVRVLTRESAADGLREAWGSCEAIVSLLAVPATVRVLAPLLGHKTSDPAVVCVDEALRFAVPVLGGHHGANELAHRLSGVLGCAPVVTTASDAAGAVPLDSFGADLGFTIENPGLLARVGAAVLSGEPVGLDNPGHWPVPALPPNVTSATAGGTDPLISIDDRTGAGRPGDGGDGAVLRYRPKSLVVGVGSVRGVAGAEVGRLVDSALWEAGLSPLSVRAVATVDLKADEAGIAQAAAERGWPVVTYPAETLSAIEVPNPSQVVRDEVGTPSVAEAAALAAARSYGRDATLVVDKRKSANATVAVARLTPRGRLSIVGLGPGARDLLAPRAQAALRRASVIVGLDQYVDQVRDLIRPGTRVIESGLGQEEERARTAVREAHGGAAVALVGSGDAGIYAMAGPALEFADGAIEVEGVPGITAAIAASNLLGAPLGHDHAYISLSDLHTPWEVIERRVRAAADGDFTVCFYNPRSRTRDWQLPRALAILAERRPPQTPVGFVRNASRPGQTVTLTTLAELDPGEVDMFTVLLVGSGHSRSVAGRFVTPRGYRWS